MRKGLAPLSHLPSAIAFAAPFVAAVAHAPLYDDGAHDDVIVRAIGLGVAGTPTLDSIVGAVALLLPIGTRLFRLAVVSALATGIAGAALVGLIRATLRDAGSPRLVAAVATIFSLTTTLSGVWQTEAIAPLGSTVLAAMLLAFAASFTSALAPATGQRDLRAWSKRVAPWLAAAIVLLLLALGRRLQSTLIFDGAAPHGKLELSRISQVARVSLGPITLALAVAGALVGAGSKTARVPTLVTLALGVVASGWVAIDRTEMPERFSVGALLLVAAAHVPAAIAIAALVRWVARLRVPLASASAAMVALLAAAFPAVAYDEASLALESRQSLAGVDWSEVALGSVAEQTEIVTDDPRVTKRIVACALTGELVRDLPLLPLHDVGGRLVRAEIARAPDLIPLVRDVTLTGLPTELALGKLAESRSVATVFSIRWDRAIAKHLVPSGLIDHIAVEPRGLVDRKNALERVEPSLDDLAPRLREGRASSLMAATALLLRARALSLSVAGDRELGARALDELALFSPSDPFARTLAPRLQQKGRLDLSDLAMR